MPTIGKNKNLIVMSTYHLNDKNLSLQAIGLMSKIMALTDIRDYPLREIATMCKEREGVIQAIFDELAKFGYLKIHDKCEEIIYERRF